MQTEKALSKAETLLKPWAVSMTRPEENRMDAVVEVRNLKNAVKAIRQARWGYLAAITGLDRPAPAPAEGQPASEGALEALYHFASGAAIASLRVTVPYSHSRLPSICDIIPSATLYERELMELFGIIVEDTPSPDRLVLPDDWPEGVFPLRKSFTGFEEPVTGMEQSND